MNKTLEECLANLADAKNSIISMKNEIDDVSGVDLVLLNHYIKKTEELIMDLSSIDWKFKNEVKS